MLTGTKILTVFAPVDSAFTEADMKRFEENRAQARSLVLRHVTTGTLYSAGMQYYQQRESLDKGRQLTVLKEAGEYRSCSSSNSSVGRSTRLQEYFLAQNRVSWHFSTIHIHLYQSFD